MSSQAEQAEKRSPDLQDGGAVLNPTDVPAGPLEGLETGLETLASEPKWFEEFANMFKPVDPKFMSKEPKLVIVAENVDRNLVRK